MSKVVSNPYGLDAANPAKKNSNEADPLTRRAFELPIHELIDVGESKASPIQIIFPPKSTSLKAIF